VWPSRTTRGTSGALTRCHFGPESRAYSTSLTARPFHSPMSIQIAFVAKDLKINDHIAIDNVMVDEVKKPGCVRIG